MNADEKIRDLEEKLRTARRAIAHSAKIFHLYADIHRANDKPDSERKMKDNLTLAVEMETALEDTNLPETGQVFIQN